MQHIRQILKPGEHVLCSGRVHPVVYVPGLLSLLIGALVWWGMQHLQGFFPAANFSAWSRHSGSWLAYVPDVVAMFFFLKGALDLVNAYLLSASTEFAVTDKRIICKSGITTVNMLEIERGKIASVLVRQSVMGQVFDYGWLTLQGYAGMVAALPVMGSPYRLQNVIYGTAP